MTDNAVSISCIVNGMANLTHVTGMREYRVFIYNLPTSITRAELTTFTVESGVNWSSARGLRLPGGLNSAHIENSSRPTETAVLFFDTFKDASRAVYLMNNVRLRGRIVYASFDRVRQKVVPSVKDSSLAILPEATNNKNVNAVVSTKWIEDMICLEDSSQPQPSDSRSASPGHRDRESEAKPPVGKTSLAYIEPIDRILAPGHQPWGLYVLPKNTPPKNIPKAEGKYEFHCLTTKSMFVLGRDLSNSPFTTDDLSCEMYHAVVQFRFLSTPPVYSASPCLFDLGSKNGSFVNGQRVAPKTFVLLRSRDVLQFGNCNREYVIVQAGPNKEKQ